MKKPLTLLVLCLLAACGGGNSPTQPASTTSMAGTWVGVATEKTTLIAGCTAGSTQVTLSQTGSSVGGSWLITYPNASCNNSGSAVGTVTGTSVTLTLTPSVPTSCPFTVTGTLTAPTFLSGTYAAFNCSVASSGTFVIQKQ